MSISYGFLSTYTPTECGLVTFTAASPESSERARGCWLGFPLP